mgnify:CR=1 FL=1
MEIPRTDLPEGIPTFTTSLGRIWVKKLRSLTPDWNQTIKISKQFGTALCPPYNLWWKDLPIEWIYALNNQVKKAIIEKNENNILNFANIFRRKIIFNFFYCN